MFFTIWYGVYTLSTRRLEYASAGHPPALLTSVLSNGKSKTKLLRTRNSALGVKINIEFNSEVLNLKPSSRLYIFSDGVYEISQKDGSIWGFKKFYEFMTRPLNSKSSILKRLTDHVSPSTQEECLNDDFTMLEIIFI